ncbi:PIN domain-containing protein [soil metagenome]
MVDRLFLDANVLFSAAYCEGAGVAALWSIKTVSLFTSSYAIEEARRNLPNREQQERLERLAKGFQTVHAASVYDPLRNDIELPAKDRPILSGALTAECTHLITGDIRHFGRYFGKRLLGIHILPPADYVREARQHAQRIAERTCR